MATLQYRITPQMCGEGQDSFDVIFSDGDIGKLYENGKTSVTVRFDPDTFRHFWTDAGDLLREFDQRAGAPSNDDLK